MGIERSQSCPAWVKSFVEELAKLIQPRSFMGQLGFRYLDPLDEKNTTRRWLIAIYAVPHEVAGGKHDGSSVVADFTFDVLKLLKLFSEVSTLEWKVNHCYTDGLDGPEVWLEGVYRSGEKVRVHVYSDPPADESPTVIFDVRTSKSRFKT